MSQLVVKSTSLGTELPDAGSWRVNRGQVWLDEYIAVVVNRIDLGLEALIWTMALEHLGQNGLLEAVVDLLRDAAPPTKQTVEYLESARVGQVVVDVVRVAQEEVGAFVPFREGTPNQVILYSLHAQHLTRGLMHRLPIKALPRPLQVLVLENDMGV